MDFQLSEAHEAARDLATEILGAASSPERHAALEEGEWIDRDLWRSLADAGLVGLGLADNVGGAGLDFLGVHLLLEQVGATAAHVPFYETVVLGALPIDRHGTDDQRRRLLPDVASGERILTSALTDEAPAEATAPAATLTPEGDGWRLEGIKTAVPCAGLADTILVSATREGRAVIVLVDPAAAGMTVEPQDLVADVPAARIVLDGVHVADEDLLGGPDADASILGDVVELAVAGLASLQSGTVGEALRLAASYTSEREQFGRPIATFQAVTQRIAGAYIEAEALRLVTLQAAWRLAEGEPATEQVAIAKWWAGEAGHHVVHAAQHVHGGVGVDREYPLHRLFGRAKLHEFLLGTAADHLGTIGRLLAAEPA